MSNVFEEILRRSGIDPEEAEEPTTVADLQEALNILTNIVLGGDE